MFTASSRFPTTPAREHMGPARALRLALTGWFVCVCVAAAAAGFVLAFGLPGPGGPEIGADMSGSVAMIGLAGAAIPLAFAYHWRLFRKHWRDGYVEPVGYLKASLVVHVTITVCIVGISVACLVRGSMMPEIVLILAMLALLMLTWPNGWSMTRPVPLEEEDDEQDLLHIPPTPHR